MRFVNAGGRAGLLVDGAVHGLAELSGGRLPADPMQVVISHWDEALRLHRAGTLDSGRAVESVRLGAPVPAPRSVYAIGLNYRAHAREAGLAVPPIPSVFTKFPSSIAGCHDDIVAAPGGGDHRLGSGAGLPGGRGRTAHLGWGCPRRPARVHGGPGCL